MHILNAESLFLKKLLEEAKSRQKKKKKPHRNLLNVGPQIELVRHLVHGSIGLNEIEFDRK